MGLWYRESEGIYKKEIENLAPEHETGDRAYNHGNGTLDQPAPELLKVIKEIHALAGVLFILLS
jgi:hypothetical protein